MYLAGWWNWQTQETQNLPVEIPCGFESHSRYKKGPGEISRAFFYGLTSALRYISVLQQTQFPLSCWTLYPTTFPVRGKCGGYSNGQADAQETQDFYLDQWSFPIDQAM